MKREDFLPYLNKFITVELDNGTRHSGYISNPKDIENSENEDPEIKLINGFYTENVHCSKVDRILLTDREDTVSIPVIDLKKGYELNRKEIMESDQKLDELFNEVLNEKNNGDF